MKWWFIVIVIIAAIVLMPKQTWSTMTGKNQDNNSDERMKKIRAIKKQKAKEREDLNRSKMKKAA